MLATDLVLYFIILRALLRLCHESGGMLDPGRLLWRQVS